MKRSRQLAVAVLLGWCVATAGCNAIIGLSGDTVATTANGADAIAPTDGPTSETGVDTGDATADSKVDAPIVCGTTAGAPCCQSLPYCATGFMCKNSVCNSIVLADNETTAQSVTVDNTAVYWVQNLNPGKIRRYDKASGAITSYFETANKPVAIGVDTVFAPNAVYWIEPSPPVIARCELLMAPGCSPVPFVPDGIPTSVNATGQMFLFYGTADKGVFRVQKSTFGSMPPIPVAMPQAGPVVSIALDAANLYWYVSDSAGAGVYVQPKGAFVDDAGGGIPPTPVKTAPGSTGGVLTDSGNIYFYTVENMGNGAATIFMCVPGGNCTSPPPNILVGNEVGIRAVAVESQTVYWITGGPTGALKTCTMATCASNVTTLVPNINGPQSLAVDANFIYVTAGNQVLRYAKP